MSICCSDLHQETLAREVPPQRDAVRAAQGTDRVCFPGWRSGGIASSICLAPTNFRRNHWLSVKWPSKTSISEGSIFFQTKWTRWSWVFSTDVWSTHGFVGGLTTHSGPSAQRGMAGVEARSISAITILKGHCWKKNPPNNELLGAGFKYVLCSSLYVWGRFPFLLRFFKGVETN